MKTRKSFKWVLSLAVLTAIFSSTLATMSFADEASNVTWREKFSTINLTIPETETYDAENGTFGESGRAVNYTNTGSSSNYMYGVELTEALKSGKVTVELELSNIPNIAPEQQMYLFAVSSESKGWTVQSDSTTSELRSELVIRDSKGQVQSSRLTALDNTYRARWNTELVTLVSGSGVKLDRDSNGVHKLRFVAEAADENSAWNISIYHYGKSDKIPVYTYTISRTALPDLKYIFNQARIANNATLTFNVDKFLVTTVTGPKVVEATDGRIAYNAPLSITFDSAVEPDTISGIELKQGETVVDAVVTLDETTNKTVTIDPISDLVDGEEYQIVVPATVKGANGIYVAQKEINVTAIDALFFTNLASQYNPTANVTESYVGRCHIDGNELVLDGGVSIGKSYGFYRFEIPAAKSGVYYADVKFTMSKNSDFVKLGVRSSKVKSLFKATKATRTFTPESSMDYAANAEDNALKATNNIFDLRFIIMSESQDNDWKVLLCDKATGAITHGGIIPRADVAELTSIYFETSIATVKVSDVVIRKADDVNLINPAYDENAKKLTATVATAKNGVAIAAAYGVDGRLLQTVATPLNPSSSTPDMIDVTFTTPEEIVSKKLMVWDGFGNCNPLLLNPYE